MSRPYFLFFQLATEFVLIAAILIMAGAGQIEFVVGPFEFKAIGSASGGVGGNTTILVPVLVALFAAVFFASFADRHMFD